MKYVIGDVARTLGLTTAGLHFFEKEGVIAPRKGDGTRRTYNAEDIIRLISYKKYRSMQLPLKEIAHQFSPKGETLQGIQEKMSVQREEMLLQARRCEQLAADIQWFEQAILRAESSLDQVDLAFLPESYALVIGSDGFISHSKAEQERVAEWLEHQPATHFSTLAREDGHACFGYTMEASRAKALGLDRTPGVEHLPSALALHTCHKLPQPYFEEPERAFVLLGDHMRQRGFRQKGTAIAVNLCVECRDGLRDTLCEVWLPIL